MTAYIVRRLWQMIPTMLGVVLLVFFLFNWVGGDPAYVLAGKISNQEQIDNIRRQLGVDEPSYVQLGIFLKQIVTADFGASWSTNERIGNILMTRLGPSLTVLVPLLIIDTLLAIGLALAVAYVRGSLTDRAVMIICTVGLSISILVYIIVFQYVFAYKLGWFPVQGWGNSFWENLFVYSSLPILIGLVVGTAPNLRLYRTFVLDEINQDYVRTARAKGVSENRIMWVHVLRNASIPIITHVMATLPGLLVGAFLIERFFSIPGIGREVILAVERSDFPVIKAITVYVAVATMVANLAADLMYKAVDPRVQLK
ncbi:MAG TPA: ABC transporter permease [Casimicrobiaceae bacterium]|nr:ABC transporter permease [Casimicrobiaceae bacterium]